MQVIEPILGIVSLLLILLLLLSLLVVLKRNRRLTSEQREMIEKMQKTIRSQEDCLVSSYLLALLKGRTTKLSGKEQELGLKLSLSSGCFALVGCYVPQKEEKPEKDDLDFFIVDNVFSELMEGEMFYRIEDGRFMITYW